MKKLKIALTVLLAFTASLALFACKDKTKDNGDSNLGAVFVDGTLTFTDVQTSGDWAGKLDQLKITAYYEGSEDEVTLTTDDVTIDNSAVEWGKVGTYKATVTPTERNEEGISTSFNVVIDHNFVAVDGQPGVSACSKDGATKTEKEIADTLDFGAWTSFRAYVGENNTAVKAFGASSRGETPVATAGRIDKGMTITLTAQVKTIGAGEAVVEGGTETGNSNTWNVPLPGIADREYGASYVERFDTWGIYTINNLNGWTLAPYGKSDTGTTEGTATKDSEELVAYAEGVTAVSSAFETWTDVEFKWAYSSDCVITFTRTLLASGDSRIITMKLPERQFYETVLQGEFVRMKFSKISVVQDLKLTGVGDVTVPTAKNYVENEMIDPASFDVNVNYAGGLTGKADPAILTVYGNANANATLDTAEGWVNLSDEKLTSDIKAYKLHVQIAEDGFDAMVPAAEAAKIVIAQNAVDHAVATDVDGFTSYGLDQLSFGNKGGKAIVTAVAGDGIECVATSLTEAQKTKLGNADAYTSYVAFTLYQNGPTQFAKGTVTVKSGTTTLPAIVNVTPFKTQVVIALNATVDRSNIVISGIQPTDVLVDLSALGGLEVPSKVTVSGEYGDLYFNGDNGEAQTITIEYTLDSSVTAEQVANTYRLTVNGISKNLKADGSNVTYSGTNGNITGIPGMSVAVSFTSGKLTATYTVPSLDPANPLLYTFRLVNKSTGAVVASDSVAYNYIDYSADAEQGSVEDAYIVADKDNPYLYIAIGGTVGDLWISQLSMPFGLTLNAGAATPQEKQSYSYLQQHDLSWTFDLNGTPRFTSSVLEGLATINAYTFGGTFNNFEDTDHCIVIVLRIDTSVLGYDKDDVFYFTSNMFSSVYKVDENRTISEVETTEGNAKSLGTATCTESATQVTPNMVGSTEAFYTGASLSLNEHSFGAANTDGWAECTVCGALKYTGATRHGLDVAAIDGAAEKGLTIAYKSYATDPNKTGDWTAHVINPFKDADKTLTGVIVTGENLDPWNNTLGLGTGNAFPTAAGAITTSAYAWKNMFAVSEENAVNVMIMIDKTLGVRYYKDGQLAVRYPVDMAIGSMTGAKFVEELLKYVDEFGFRFMGNYGAEETIEGKDLIAFAGTADSDVVAGAFYASAFGLPAPAPTISVPATPNGYEPTVNVTNEAQIEDFNTQGYAWNMPVKTFNSVTPGRKVVLHYTQSENSELATSVWHTTTVHFTSGLATEGGPWGVLRGDGWLGEPTALNGDSAAITSVATSDGKDNENNAEIWLAALKKGLDVTVTIDWTDVNNLTVTILYVGEDINMPAVEEVKDEAGTVTTPGREAYTINEYVRTVTFTINGAYVGPTATEYWFGLGGEHVAFSDVTCRRF